MKTDKMKEHRQEILDILGRFRYLFNQLCANPDIILTDICDMRSYGDIVYPCDVIELRGILRDLSIKDKDPIPFFSLKFAEKYLKRFPIFLVVSEKSLYYTSRDYTALKLYDLDSVDISDSLKRIIINEPISPETKKSIYDIVKEIGTNVECLVSNSIPGISSINPRLSFVRNGKMMKKCQTVDLPNVRLNSDEQKIFNFLADVKKQFGLDIEFRVAGGWVRDKLMGKESDDIDIAISNMTGSQLVEYIKKHPQSKQVMGKDYTVPANPEKSKHLETATINLFNNSIDFVNLRSESYGDTRVPTMEMGTPETDSQRRDITINSLFYNIETGQVEDYVGGLEDMNNKVLRTPMDPVQTFKDDPLRMLRAVRFKSRFPDFQVAPELVEAMKDPKVQEAYKNKVSPERAGPELMKTMVGADPAEAVSILFDTDLYKSVFNVPDMENISPDGIHMDQRTPWHKYNLKDHILEVIRNLNNMMTEKGETDKMRGLMNLSALFHDFGKMKSDIPTPHPKNPEQMQYINHEVASARMAEDILKSIGVGKDDRDIVHQVIRHHMVPHSIGNYGNKGRANFLRKTRMHGKEEEHKDLWKYIFYHAQADDMSSQPDDYDADKRQQEFDRFQQYVEKPPTPPRLLVNGNDVKNVFPEVAPGPWISQILGEMQSRQDAGDFGTYEEAIGVLKTLTPQINNGDNTMSANWYGKMKTSQQSRPQPLPKEDETDVVKGPKPHASKYQIGMKVNDRRKGVALKQEYGEVMNIEGNEMKINWFNKEGKKHKEEIFDIVEDTIPLSLIVGTGN